MLQGHRNALSRWIVFLVIALLSHHTSVVAQSISVSWKTPVNYPVLGQYPLSICSGDFDRDGFADIAVGSESNLVDPTSRDTISVLFNNGDGTFTQIVSMHVAGGCNSICSGDLDSDGFPDLAVTNMRVDSVTVIHNTGGRSFAAPRTYPAGVGSHPLDVALADVDGDGALDIISALQAYGVVEKQGVGLQLNNGAGIFGNLKKIYSITQPVRVYGVDLAKRGQCDIVVGRGLDSITFLTGVDTQFVAKSCQNYRVSPVMDVGDMDLDGNLELVSAGYWVSVFDSISQGPCIDIPSFEAGEIGTSGTTARVVDVDGDGLPEVVSVSYEHRGVLIYRNTGFKTLENCGGPPTGDNVVDMTVADFDGNGFPDLALANLMSKDISVILSVPCCTGGSGNVDCDPAKGVDISDLATLIDNLYISFSPTCCIGAANVDGQPGIDIGDLTALIDYLYINFTPLAGCHGT